MLALKITIILSAILCILEFEKVWAAKALSARLHEKLNFGENQVNFTSKKADLENIEQIKRALRASIGYMLKSSGSKRSSATDSDSISSSSSDSQSSSEESSESKTRNLKNLRKLHGDLIELASLIKTEACYRRHSYLSKQRGLFSSKKQKLIPVYDICLPQPSAYVHTIPMLGTNQQRSNIFASTPLPPPPHIPSLMEYEIQQPRLFHMRNN